MKRTFRTPVFILLLLVLLCCHVSVASAASPRDISISVQWTDAWGNAQVSDPALPVTDLPEENRFWLTVPFDAPLYGLTLQISDLSGELVSFVPAQGETLQNVQEAADLTGPYTEIFAYNAYGEQTAVFWLYISTQPLPQEEAPVQGGTVTVRYLDDSWNPIAPDSVQTLAPGDNTVYPDVYPSPDEYELTSADSYHVFVDANGANPSEVQFVYRRVPQTALITVHYLDEFNRPLIADNVMSLEEGVHTVSAPDFEGYTLVSPGSFTVTVDAAGAKPSDITFAYALPPISANVTAHFLDDQGMPIQEDRIYTFDRGDHLVDAQEIEGYEISGQQTYSVVISDDGAEPAEVTFIYTRRIPDAQVVLRYVNEAEEALLADSVQILEAGTHTVYPQEVPGYVLTGESAREVTVDMDGAHPSEITFVYVRGVLPDLVTIHYVDERGETIALDDIQQVPPGESQVFPAANISPDDYLLTGASYYDILVTTDGADSKEVTFVYQRVAKPVTVTLHYVDDLGNPIAADTYTLVEPGIHAVSPEAIIPQDEYALLPPEAVDVTVDVDGAEPAEVTFVYTREVLPDLVTIHYVDERGETIAPDDIQQVPPGKSQVFPVTVISTDDYLLTGAFYYDILVTADGANLNEVTFTYHRLWHYEYTVLEDGTAEITDCKGDGKALVIPEALDGIQITGIGNKALSYLGMSSVTIPDSVIHIGINPFIGCEKLQSIVVSQEHPTLSVIDGVLLSKPDNRLVTYPAAKKDKKYTVPNGVQVIGNSSIWGNDFLREIEFPDTVLSIEENAFHCKNLKNISLPSSLLSIAESAFSSCDSIISISIPASVEKIGEGAFLSCANLSRIIVSPESPVFADIDGVLFSKTERKLLCYPIGKNESDYSVPNGIKMIGKNAFRGCKNLSSIVLPETVTEIGAEAFFGCNNLFSVNLPNALTEIHDSTFGGCTMLNEISIPNAVTQIGACAFVGCASLTEVLIPSSVKSIGDHAFVWCDQLKSVTIPASVESIGSLAFIGHPDLTLHVERNTYAAQYCQENKLNYTYPDSLDWLNDW